MVTFTACPPHKKKLEALLEEGVYHEQILRETDFNVGPS